MNKQKVKQTRYYDQVTTDIMWRQRVNLEEVQLLSSYAGPKAHKIGNVLALQNSQHFYSKPTGSHVSDQLRVA